MSVALEAMSPYARGVVERLGLAPHPEGGWYVRDWQSPVNDRSGRRPLASLIYFLLAEGDASAWHKVDADEIWLWHGPAPVTIETAGDGDRPADERVTVTLGTGIAGSGSTGNSDSPATIPTDTDETDSDAPAAAPTDTAPVGHLLIPAGVWQRTIPGPGDALVSCVVSPGFEFSGFTLDDPARA